MEGEKNQKIAIHSSLAIEHNSLTKEQVTAIINGKSVLGNPNEIKEDEDATDQDGDQETDQVKKDNPNVRKLLDVIGDETMSAKELMDEMSLSHRPTFRNNYLNPALELGVIERTIPDKPNSRNQRYRKIKGEDL